MFKIVFHDSSLDPKQLSLVHLLWQFLWHGELLHELKNISC